MVIFLYGPDDYRRAEKRKSIEKEFKKKYSSLSVGRFDITEDGTLDAFRAFARNQSIFEPVKLAIVENFFELDAKAVKKELEPYLEEKGITILLSEKNKPVKALDFLLKKPTISQEFEFLTGKEYEDFISKEAKSRGFSFALQALKFLALVYQKDTWRLVTELDKFAGLGKKMLDMKDAEEFGLEATPDFWSTMNRLRGKALGERLGTLEELFGKDEPAAKIFNMIAAIAKEKTPAFAEYDLMIKSGKLEYEEALVDFVLQ